MSELERHLRRQQEIEDIRAGLSTCRSRTEYERRLERIQRLIEEDQADHARSLQELQRRARGTCGRPAAGSDGPSWRAGVVRDSSAMEPAGRTPTMATPLEPPEAQAEVAALEFWDEVVAQSFPASDPPAWPGSIGGPAAQA